MALKCIQGSTRKVNRAMLKQVGFRRASERESIKKTNEKIRFYKTPRDGFMLETPLGERSERASAASEASRAIRMDSVSCRVKAVQKMPSGFVKVAKKKY